MSADRVANDTAPPASVIQAQIRAVTAKFRRERAETKATALQFHASDRGLEHEWREVLATAWANLGLAAAEAERAEVELAAAKLASRGVW